MIYTDTYIVSNNLITQYIKCFQIKFVECFQWAIEASGCNALSDAHRFWYNSVWQRRLYNALASNRHKLERSWWWSSSSDAFQMSSFRILRVYIMPRTGINSGWNTCKEALIHWFDSQKVVQPTPPSFPRTCLCFHLFICVFFFILFLFLPYKYIMKDNVAITLNILEKN